MKLLFDENLSRRLVARLAELFPGSAHVAEIGLLESPDWDVWEHARAFDFIIVSTDSGFYDFATTIGPPPKVICFAAGSTRPVMPNGCSDGRQFESPSSQSIPISPF